MSGTGDAGQQEPHDELLAKSPKAETEVVNVTNIEGLGNGTLPEKSPKAETEIENVANIEVLGNGKLPQKSPNAETEVVNVANIEGLGNGKLPEKSPKAEISTEVENVANIEGLGNGKLPEKSPKAETEIENVANIEGLGNRKLPEKCPTSECGAMQCKTDEKEEMLDVLGNGTLLKRILIPGYGCTPVFGDRVIVHVESEIPELNKVLPDEVSKFILGDGDVVPAMELAVALMKVGEKCQVITGYKYMYGDIGLDPDVPPKSNFKLTIELLARKEPYNYKTLDFDTRFAQARVKKETGNFLFKRREYEKALTSYIKGSAIIDQVTCFDASSDKLQELLEFSAVIKCNICATQYRLGDYKGAVISGKETIAVLPAYSKAYIRLGQAHEKLGHIAETIKNYKLALENDARNTKWLNEEIERLELLDDEKKMHTKTSKEVNGARPKVNLNDESQQPSCSNNIKQYFPEVPSSTQSSNLDGDKKPYTFLLPRVMCEFGNTFGPEIAPGAMSEDEMNKMLTDYLSNCPDKGAALDPQQLMAASEQMASLIPQEVRELLESLTNVGSENAAVDKGNSDEKSEKANSKEEHQSNTTDTDKEDEKACVEKLPNPAAEYKSEPISTAYALDFAKEPAGVFFDEGKEEHQSNTTDTEKEDQKACVEKLPNPAAEYKSEPISTAYALDFAKEPAGVFFNEGKEEHQSNTTDTDKEDEKACVEKLPNPAAEYKSEPISTAYALDFAKEPAGVFFDEGTDVDTGVTQVSRTHPSYMYEIEEEFIAKKKEPEKKSSWWKMSATVMGAGLVGLAGFGIYKYLNH